MAAWTHKRLLKAVWRRLNDPAVRLSPRVLSDCAACIEAPSSRSMAAGGGPRHVKVDSFQVGWIPAVIHELLHDALAPSMDGVFGKDVQERIVEALEADLAEMVLGDPAATERWRNAIVRRSATTRRGAS